MKKDSVTSLKIKSKTLRNDKTPVMPAKNGVRKIGDFIPVSNHVSLSSMAGQTIYITKLEPIHSESFGEGYKLTFKDFPNAKDEMTAAPFGAAIVPILAGVYDATNNGALVTEKSPLQAKIVLHGKVLSLE